VAASPQSAVDKALDLLDAIARSTTPLKLSELAEEVGMLRPTAHRVLAELVGRGWVFRYDGRYLPGAAFLQLSTDAAANSLAAICQPALLALSESTDMMVNLQVLEKDGSRVIAAERPERFKMITRMVGDLLPPHRFAGALALTAALDDKALAPYLSIVEQTGYPVTGASGFLADVAETRATGFALVRQRSQEIVSSVSRAIAPRVGSPLCALTVIAFSTDFDDEARLNSAKAALLDAANDVEQLLTDFTSGATKKKSSREDA
jgi:IclR family transcriptional regulator, acetate operon repressor